MSDWPVIKITGGPHAKNTKITVNGDEIPKVTRVEVTLDVNDAVRVTTYHLASADIELEVAPGMIENGYIAKIRQIGVQEVSIEGREPGFIPIQQELSEGKGKTLREALQAAIDALPPDPE